MAQLCDVTLNLWSKLVGIVFGGLRTLARPTYKTKHGHLIHLLIYS
jgi:hypothetical protein